MNNCTNIANALKTFGFYHGRIEGYSMNPLLKMGKHSVFIVPVSRPLKKLDVALFLSCDGKYVLHRIRKIDGDNYTFLGDNCFKPEKNIDKSQILGVLEGYYKGEKYILCNSTAFKIKSRIICFPPVRLALVVFGAIKRKICKQKKFD